IIYYPSRMIPRIVEKLDRLGVVAVFPHQRKKHTPLSPMAKSLDLVTRRDSHGHDVLRGLNERNIEQRRQPAARLALSPAQLRPRTGGNGRRLRARRTILKVWNFRSEH
ncbi:MAG: hypothetical protein WCJ18_03030, partial [Planctomycetota bacterium]